VVRGVASQHLVGQGEALRRHHQRNHHLHAIGTVIARVAKLTNVLIFKRRINLKIGAGQVVQQDIEGDVEQVSPATYQVIKKRLLVLEQSIMTAVQYLFIDRLGSTEQI